MVSNSLFNIQSFDGELTNAIHSSIRDFGQEQRSANFWAMTSLQRHIEEAAKNITQKNNLAQGFSGVNPPGGGFRVTFGLQIQVGYTIRLRGSANVGYGNRWGNFGGTSSLHFSAYNGGLGTGVNKNNLVVDVTAAVNLTVGGGTGTPLQSYALNYNAPIPSLNTFKNSFSYGQLLTWNSAINNNQFSLDNIQREGMIGFRLGDVNVSSNNDTRIGYFGGGTDMGWTGGLVVTTPFFEVGFQDFSGDYFKGPRDGKGSFNDDERRELLRRNNENPFESGFHRQSPYQKRLNKASTYVRINSSDGYTISVDLIGDAWLQNAIHKAIKDFKFEYNYKTIEAWGGKNW
jgi:hypothetical protein